MSSLQPNLFSIFQNKQQISICISSQNQLSPTKFLFDKKSIIEIPRVVEFQNPIELTERIITYNKTFNNDYFVHIKKLNIDFSSNIVIPYFKSKSFTCMSCKKYHNGKSEKCCTLEKSPILLHQAKLYKLELPELSTVREKILAARQEFIELHFPDFLDTILLR
jgi:hypothetical protein